MPGSQNPAVTFEKLREQAEVLVKQQAEITADGPSDILELIHELKIHQAELEIQNEDLQRAQHEIAELHREYRNLYEFAPCGYLTLNNRGMITHVNLTGNRLLNVDRNQVLRAGFTQFIDSGWENTFLSARAKSAQTRRKQSVELPIKRKNDLPLWVRLEIEADRDEKDAVTLWRVALIDISEKKKAAEALEKSEARYRKMMESISDPLYVCSFDRTIEFLNPAMMKRLGRDAIGETCYKAIHGLSEVCERCPFDKVRNGETVERNLVSHLDGRSYRVTHMPVYNDDRTVSKLGIYRDITDYIKAVEEKERAQARLYKAQKMESIGNLAGGIAHDFNNMLAVIMGNTELAIEDVDQGTLLADNLHEIYLASKRARDVVKQILTFARKTDERLEPVNVGDIGRETIKLLRSSLPTTITIKQSIDCDSKIYGNAGLLQQAFMNLATNALHAMEDNGGQLEITISDVAIDSNSAKHHDLLKLGAYVEIKIADTGTGISKEVIDSIFEPYFTTKGVGSGTGMGLAMVHGTVKKYGGTIWVESLVGHGSVFTILLPAMMKRDQLRSDQPETMPRGAESILFVDDEPSIAKLGRLILERLGYSVTGKTSSLDALALFKAHPDQFDLVITDMTMPELTGDRLTIELLKIRRDIPVILLTGYSKKISDETALEMGIRAFGYKPIVQADLAKIVRKVLDEAEDYM